MGEYASAEKFFFTKLSASTALTTLVGSRIYSEIAISKPGEALVYPLVVFMWGGGQDAKAMAGKSLFLNEIYTVKIIGEGNSYASIEAGAVAIQTALHNQRGAVTGGQVLFCQREAPVKYVEPDGGKIYRHLGATYRIFSK